MKNLHENLGSVTQVKNAIKGDNRAQVVWKNGGGGGVLTLKGLARKEVGGKRRKR